MTALVGVEVKQSVEESGEGLREASPMLWRPLGVLVLPACKAVLGEL